METIDLEKLGIAIKYVQRIADGNNPINNLPMEDDAILNNPNVIRCMFFVKEVLELVQNNGGAIVNKKTKANVVQFPFEVLERYQYQGDKSIANFLMQISSLDDSRNIAKISPKTITSWLKKEEYLIVSYSDEVMKESTMPTEKGKSIGIYSEPREYNSRVYLAVIYNQNAQEFLVKNLKTILTGGNIE